MHEHANRAEIVRKVFTASRIGWRSDALVRGLRAGDRPRAGRGPCDVVEMHVAERNDELERERKQRQIRSPFRTRPEPAHRRNASRALPKQKPFPPAAPRT